MSGQVQNFLGRQIDIHVNWKNLIEKNGSEVKCYAVILGFHIKMSVFWVVSPCRLV
jgi:hypothetical protein